jgi:hypothetical protein
MKNFLQIASGIDVMPVALALQRQPELWNQHNERKEFAGSAHTATSDIWVRYNDPANLAQGYDKFTAEHDAVWYPTYHALPQLRPIIFGLMAKCESVRLGGVLITRIPPGGHVLPHADSGWHPEYYNMKLYVPILANPQCVNRVEDERVVMAPGDCWYFNNLKEHEVINSGDTERVTLIICLRCDG